MKEQEIIIDTVSSEDTKRKPISAEFELPQVQDFESRYGAEMPRRRGAAPSTRRAEGRSVRSSEKGKNPEKRTKDNAPQAGVSKKKKTPNPKKKRILLVVLSILLVLVLLGSCKLIQFLNNPLLGETDEDIINEQDAVQGNMVTVLLVGTDGGGTNTDTLILAILNTSTKEVSLVSVPRDTRVPNPHGGIGYAKINSVYAAKGMSGLISQVRDVTGMPINFYAMINFKGFREAVDILGGVRFNVPVRMKYFDPTQDLNIDLYPGMQLLDGNKAEQLVRCRNVYAQADLARTEVQRDFIIALLEQHATLGNVTKIPELFKAMEPYVKTSITANDAIKYGTAIAGIKSDSIQSYMLPGAAGSYGKNNVSYFVYDADKVEELGLEIGFKKSLVKHIPSPGKPNGGVTDADDVDADQTLKPGEEPPADDDETNEDKDTDKDKDKDSDKDNDKDKNSDKDKDKDSGKDSDKDNDKTDEKPSTDTDKKPDDSTDTPSTESGNSPTDYPDGI